jgi:hypothetical protein
MDKFVKARKTIFKDWAFIEGQWVYVPLWDPAPDTKKFKGYKQLFLANAINDIAAQLANPKSVEKLNSITKELLAGVSKAGQKSWEDGDGICPDWWPWPWPGPRPIDDLFAPLFFPDNLNKKLTSLIGGQLLHNLGDQAKMPQLQEIAKEIMG